MLSGKGVAFCHILNVCDVMRVQSIAYQYPCHPLATPTTPQQQTVRVTADEQDTPAPPHLRKPL